MLYDTSSEQWYDFLHAVFPRADARETMNRELATIHAVVAAALTTTSKQPVAVIKEDRKHRDDLPKLPTKWRDLY